MTGQLQAGTFLKSYCSGVGRSVAFRFSLFLKLSSTGSGKKQVSIFVHTGKQLWEVVVSSLIRVWGCVLPRVRLYPMPICIHNGVIDELKF